MLQDTKNLLKQLEPMIECAYLNGFHFNESYGPKQCAIILVQDLREAIEAECIIARGRGIVHTALLTD